MKSIATLTMNPTIDIAYNVEQLLPTRKMRTADEKYAPGGGGINVARVFVRLGGNARCLYLSGGATGPALDGLLDQHQLVRTQIPIGEATRVATAVFERATGREFRFTPPGPCISQAELQACLELLEEVNCDLLVASGSLPPGTPSDFYARVAAIMARRGIEMVLDTSGDALTHGLADSGMALIKPSRGELQQLAGRDMNSLDAIADAAMAIVGAGQARIVAVTMGHEGAMLARKEGTLYLPALKIEARSAVGAGDSFLAGMVHALARGCDAVEAFRHGMAAGSAAVLTPGTDLAFPEDIERLLPLVGAQ